MTPGGALALLTPPFLGRVVRTIQGIGKRHEWQYVGSTWPSEGSMRGWNVESVVRTQLSKWSALTETAAGTGLLTKGGLTAHNTLLCWAYALGRATSGKDKASVLDWGGGIGQYGLLARMLYPAITFEYFCRDLPLMTETGRSVFPEATFYETDEQAFARGYDFVMASSSLHYVRDWRDTLAGLVASTRGYLFVTRQPFVDRAPSFVVVQRPHMHGYDTEYPGWVMNRDEFVAAAENLGVRLVREFITGEEPMVPKAPEQPVYRGFLFGRRPS